MLATIIVLKRFAREKEDPMMKVREARGILGDKTDRAKDDAMLGELRAKITLKGTLLSRVR